MTDEAIPAARPSEPRRLHVLLLVLLPAIVQAIVVLLFAENMLLFDEFVYVEPIRAIGEGRPWLHWIWHQHNEHRIVWTKILLFAHAGLSRWNPIVEMYASALMTAVISWGIWRLYRTAGRESAAYFVPVALLLGSLAQYFNMLYGLMTCHAFSIAGMVWAIVFLGHGTWRALAAAVLAAAAATVSTLNAIIIWPIGLVVLFLTRRPWSRWLAWIAGAAACGLAYFWSYSSPGHAPDWSSAGGILRSADAFVMNVGLALSAASAPWSHALGLMTLAAIGTLWFGVWRYGKGESHAGLVALSLIALGTAAGVASVRAGPGAVAALEPKYVSYSTLGLIAPYLGLACLHGPRRRREMLGGLTAVLCIGAIAANLYGFNGATEWRKKRRFEKYLLHTIEIQPDESLGSVYFPSLARDAAAYLRAARLGPFRDAAVDVLMAPRWREATPAGPITDSAALEAHVLCPVDTLEDIAVIVGPPPGGSGRGLVHMTVTADETVVARGDLDATTVTAANRYVRATLGTPLRGCRGKDLRIRVSSDNPDPATAPYSWSYPVYYAGVTRRGRDVLERRSLGIAFNAFSYGLLE